MTATITAPDLVNGAGGDHAVRLSDGTSLTWDQLILDFRPRLLSYARSRGIREPEDLVQDVFVAAVVCLRVFEGDRAALRSLLFAIAYRRIADEHRRGYRRPEILTADHSTVPDPGPSIDDVVGFHDEVRLAMDAFSVLNRRERRVLEMRLLDGATPAEVARALGLSTGNVRVIQARALVKVRHHLENTLGQGSTISVPALGIPYELIRGLRDRPARRGLLREWVESLKASSNSAALPTGSAPNGRKIVGLLSRTGQTGHTIPSLTEGAGPGVAKIGALVTVLALGIGAGGQLITQDDNPPSVKGPVVEEAEPTPIPREAEPRITPEATDTRSVDRAPAPADPTEPRSVGPDGARDQAPSSEPETVLTDPSAPDDAPADDVAGVVEPVLEETVGLVDETVEVIEETVATVEGAAAFVEEVAETAVDDVVVPAVEDTLDVIGNVATPPVEETVGPILDGVDEALDDVGGALGGLLGLS